MSGAAILPRPRAIIYVRVSSDPNDRGRSVGEQEEECRAVCERNGWTVVAVYRDNDRSASRYATKSRPAYAETMAAIEAGEGDVLVTWEASRAQRDLAAYADLRDLCERLGVLLSYSGRTYNMADADDRFGTGLDALLAERESDITRNRVLRSVRANAAAGTPHGKLLYGYRREYDSTTRALLAQVEDEVTGPIVREVARRVLAGETPYAVAQDLTRRGIPTPRGASRWDLTQVKRLCVNPGYAGLRVHRGVVVGEATWPAILDAATHHALVARLSDPTRRTQRDSAVRHLLSGIAVCGVCGGRLRVQKNRGFRAYLCVEAFHVSAHEVYVDAIVAGRIVDRLERPDALDLLRVDEDLDDDVKAARAEAREKRARLDGFYDAAAAGEVTPAALARIEARLLPEIEAAEARGRGVLRSPLVADLVGPGAGARWAELEMSQQREVISALVTVRVLRTRQTRTFNPQRVEVRWIGDSGLPADGPAEPQ